jgi:acetyltransferase-like isoleucine patch superfamily enzyme
MKQHLPMRLRMFVARIREIRGISHVLGRFGASGWNAYISARAGSRDWTQVDVRPEARVSHYVFFQINSLGPAKRIIVGERAFIGEGAYFSAGDLIAIGSDALVGAGCTLLGAGHVYDDPAFPYAAAPIVSYGSIVLEPNVWMGARATIIGDVRIGFGTIIGAGSLVRHSLPALCMVVGAPSRIVKTYHWQRKEWLPVPNDPDLQLRHLAEHQRVLPSTEEYVSSLAESRRKRSRAKHS